VPIRGHPWLKKWGVVKFVCVKIRFAGQSVASNVTATAGGFKHSLFLKSDGTTDNGD